MRLVLALSILLIAPAAARADLAIPDLVVPGEEVVIGVGDEAGLEGGEVRLAPAVPGGGFGRVVLGAVKDGEARFVMPEAYTCVVGCTGERRFVPGQAVSVSVCSVPETGGGDGVLTSSIFCAGGSTVVGGRARVLLSGRVKPRRAGRLTGARWKRWGEATARARGLVHGRRAVAVATDVVDCGGRLWYSTVTVRQAGRTLQTLRDLAPC